MRNIVSMRNASTGEKCFYEECFPEFSAKLTEFPDFQLEFTLFLRNPRHHYRPKISLKYGMTARTWEY